jgi:glucose-6-phosphate-specific signal transduction histidine kinase
MHTGIREILFDAGAALTLFILLPALFVTLFVVRRRAWVFLSLTVAIAGVALLTRRDCLAQTGNSACNGDLIALAGIIVLSGFVVVLYKSRR